MMWAAMPWQLHSSIRGGAVRRSPGGTSAVLTVGVLKMKRAFLMLCTAMVGMALVFGNAGCGDDTKKTTPAGGKS